MSRIIFKKNKLIKFIGLSMVALLLGSYVSISAIDNPYQAGETLDPNCAPGEVNCTVEISSGSSQWTTSGDNIYFTGGNVGIGNNNPTSLLDLIINPQIIYEQYFIEDDGNNDSLDDATFSGTYTGDVNNGLQVWIDSEGTPDTFSYSDYNGDCPEVNNVPITGSSQSLCLGMSITFASTTGHSMYDYWYYDVYEDYQNPLTIKDDQNNIYFDLDIYNGTLKLGEYYLPLSSGSNGQVLTNDGNGYVYWDTPSVGSSPISVVGTYGLSTSSWGAGGASSSIFLGYNAGYNSSATKSNFLGFYAGYGVNVTAWSSNFLGYESGYQATNAQGSNFLGERAGYQATNANSSNFFNSSAGYQATNANNSNFIGHLSGMYATEANNSNFLGFGAGSSATNASYSNFFGKNAGTSATNASNSIFIGQNAGNSAVNADSSIFIGMNAGYNDTVDTTTSINDWSILIGRLTNTGGFKNSILLGGSVGGSSISNTKANQFMLAPSVTEMQLRGIDYTLPSSQGGVGTVLTNDGDGVLSWGLFSSPIQDTQNYGLSTVSWDAGSAEHSNFFGSNAGKSATNAINSNFFGANAGIFSTDASHSNFFGNNAGNSATNASNSNFFGQYAGFHAINASNSIFIGQQSGFNDTVNNTATYDDVTTFADTSILLGHKTSTGGFSNSIAIGAYATNTASNEFMIGSTTRPINTTVWKGTSTTATLDTATGLITTSDERLKTNIEDLSDNTLDKLLNVRTVNFNWLNGDNDKTNIGFIAQDLEQYFPELVYTNNDENNYKGVNYANMTPILVEAIREMNLKVEEIKAISPVTLGEMLSQFGDSVLSNIENGIAYLKDITVETLRVGSPERRTGITMYDEETGDPYCLSIANGEQKIVQGECGVFEDEEVAEEDLPVVDSEGIEEEGGTQDELQTEGDTIQDPTLEQEPKEQDPEKTEQGEEPKEQETPVVDIAPEEQSKTDTITE